MHIKRPYLHVPASLSALFEIACHSSSPALSSELLCTLIDLFVMIFVLGRIQAPRGVPPTSLYWRRGCHCSIGGSDRLMTWFLTLNWFKL